MNTNEASPVAKVPRWVGPVLFFLVAGVVAALGMLAVSIMERRWETQRPTQVLKPIAKWEPDSSVWGQNYPREYESYSMTKEDTTKTKYGGSFPRDYLEADPRQVILFCGYPFSKDYKQARGHYYSVTDVTGTGRLTPLNMATCWTCKSTDVPRLMDELGVEAFYHQPFSNFYGKVTHPIGCQDCHDPATMNLRITRPALREAFAAMGKDIDKATHQEMRSLVCAQCHVEYYFRDKYYLTFPWKKGFPADRAIEYYDELNFSDYTHAVSGTAMIKAQHPDFELYQMGIHAYRNVACADCHMPYKTEGGMKFTDHHVRSPLLNVANSCSVCHRWSEEEIRARVENIQDKVARAKLDAEDALVRAHFDVAAAVQAGVTGEELKAARLLLRHAQFRWDYVSASNGVGFHAPQECMRILGESVNEAQQSRRLVARLLGTKGITVEPQYPDISTHAKAVEVMKAFESGNPVKML